MCLSVCMHGCVHVSSPTAALQKLSININVDSFGSLETSLVLAAGSLGQAQRTQL